MSGYGSEGVSYGDFFRNAPEQNENRRLIRGVVCGVRVEDIKASDAGDTLSGQTD